MTPSTAKPKVRIATVSLAGCFGCHMSLLDIDERLFDLVELVEFDEEGFVHLTMMGSCGGCPMSTATLTLGIEAELRRAIPEVEGVITV